MVGVGTCLLEALLQGLPDVVVDVRGDPLDTTTAGNTPRLIVSIVT
jgi:hypothetical protein